MGYWGSDASRGLLVARRASAPFVLADSDISPSKLVEKPRAASIHVGRGVRAAAPSAGKHQLAATSPVLTAGRGHFK